MSSAYEFRVATQLASFRRSLSKLDVKTLKFMLPIKFNSIWEVRLALLLQPFYWIQYLLIFARWRPDLIHVQSNEEKLSVALPALLFKIPVIWTMHGPIDTSGSRLYERYFAWSAVRASTIICITRHVLQSTIEAGSPKNNCTLIHNGVDTDEFAPSSYAPMGPITFVGRLEAVKNPLLFVATAMQLLENGHDYRFTIIGDGSLREDLIKFSSAKSEKFLFTGYKPNPLPYIKQASVLVISSDAEGMGIAAVEAMACAIPVIATNVGGLPEVVENGITGILVPSGDKAALVDAIESLLSDSDRGRLMGVAGRERARRQFSLEQMVQSTYSIYEEALHHA